MIRNVNIFPQKFLFHTKYDVLERRVCGAGGKFWVGTAVMLDAEKNKGADQHGTFAAEKRGMSNMFTSFCS